MSKRIFLTSVTVVLVLSQFVFANSSATAIGLTYVPRYGSFEDLRGKVLNANPNNFAVAVYIMVDGLWWSKPYWDSPVTKINNDSTWVCDITTGGIDETATRITVYLISYDYQPPLASGDSQLSQEIEKKAVAKAEAKRSLASEVSGVCYGPFRDNENPDMGIFPLLDELNSDIGFISKVARAIRTYGSFSGPQNISALCERVGLACYPGAWLGKYKTENREEIESLIQIANQNFNCVKALIVGNEVLLRKDMTEAELIDCIREVKKSTTLPVTTAEIWSVWKEHPKLVNEVDFLMVHIHPYWEGQPIDKAAEYVVEIWQLMRDTFPGRKIIIGETGWPSEGETNGKAVPSKENQARFFKDFIQLAEQEGIEYFYFELFDEKWKDKFEGKAGAHWGIYNSDGSLKKHMKDLIPVQAHEGISRPPREIAKVRVVAPFVVYSDAGLNENSFQPSGWMGDMDCVELNSACEVNPHSGKTCTKITYKPARFFSQGWSGIYWQFPLNNWGEYPGYEILDVSRLTFWARGEDGGEKAEFKTGGISNFGEPNRDSFGPISTGIIKLTSEWQKYVIDLKGEDTSNVIGGFCWATNHWQNPEGSTIYLDDIQFEP